MEEISSFSVQVSHRLADFTAQEWDGLSAGRPFQGYRWYRYGERVMADCQPTYIVLRLGHEPVARATLWRVKNEPLPLPPGKPRDFIQALFRRWPLLICRSPLSNASGLILPEAPLRAPALSVLANLAREQLRQQGGAFLLFDYLTEAESGFPGWPGDFLPFDVSDPGTILYNRWESFDDYLVSGNKKDRQHYKRTLREAHQLGIEITQMLTVEKLHDALELIHQVEARHGSPPNPWARAMLEHLAMVDGVFLEAKIADRLVGCGLLFEQEQTQLTAALGLAKEVPYVYFQLLYASLQIALEHRVKALRWGSGAYQVKKQLGFDLELNHFVRVHGRNPFLNAFIKLVKKYAH